MEQRSPGTEVPVIYALHGWEVRAYEQVGSTMDLGHELVSGGRSAIVVARSQSAGRGTHGRQWLSQIGGLYLSWAFPDAEDPEALLAVFAVAGIDVLVLHGLLGCSIQRPNAIHVAGKKIAGLLAESSNGGYVMGLGVNLNNEVPSSIPMTTSFKEVTARELDPRSFLTAFVRNVGDELERLLSDRRLIARRWWSLVTPEY